MSTGRENKYSQLCLRCTLFTMDNCQPWTVDNAPWIFGQKLLTIDNSVNCGPWTLFLSIKDNFLSFPWTVHKSYYFQFFTLFSTCFCKTSEVILVKQSSFVILCCLELLEEVLPFECNFSCISFPFDFQKGEKAKLINIYDSSWGGHSVNVDKMPCTHGCPGQRESTVKHTPGPLPRELCGFVLHPRLQWGGEDPLVCNCCGSYIERTTRTLFTPAWRERANKCSARRRFICSVIVICHF